MLAEWVAREPANPSAKRFAFTSSRLPLSATWPMIEGESFFKPTSIDGVRVHYLQ
jgi:hypothetical protein